MKNNAALASFGALSQPKRLHLVERLARAGAPGVSAGEIARMLRISPPNLSFHLRVLEEAGLLRSQRSGRSIFYSVNHRAIDDLIAYLKGLPRGSGGTAVSSKPAGRKAAAPKPRRPARPAARKRRR